MTVIIAILVVCYDVARTEASSALFSSIVASLVTIAMFVMLKGA
jgi:hypothetical protein